MKYKLMISDYDGTLGSAPKNDIDKEIVSAIKEFSTKGGKFVVCSGRAFSSIRKICLEQGLTGLVVSFQGAKINDLETGKVIYDGGLDAQTAVEVIDKFKEKGLDTLAYIGDEFFYSGNSPYVAYYEKMIRLNGVQVPDLEKTILEKKQKVCKVCAMCEADATDLFANEFNAEYKGERVTFNSGAKHLLEAINPKSDKGFAVKFLANYYGVDLKEVITVGDSTNDCALINGEWHGVAVGDGHPDLKAVADEITVPFKDKPIKYLLEKYCL